MLAAAVRRSISDLPGRVRARLARLTRADVAHAIPTVLLLVAVWTVFGIFVRPLTHSGPSLDEKHFLWEGWSLNRGLAPYRDFTDFKPPLVFICNAIALKVLGLTGQHYRYFFDFLAWTGLTALVLALVTRRVSKLLILALALIICALWLDQHYHDSSLDDAESIGMSFYLMGVASLLWAPRAKRITDFLGGFFLLLAVLSKEPFLFVAVPTWLTCLLIPLGDSDGSARRRMVEYAKASLVGVGVVAFWLVGYMLAKRCLGDYLAAMRLYLPFAKKICITYGAWKPAGFWADWAERWRRLTVSLVNFGALAMAVPLLVASLAFGRGKQWPAIAAAWGVAAGGLYAVTLGGCFYEHYFMLGMAGLFFLMAFGLLQLTPSDASLSPRWRLFVGLSVMLIPAWHVWPWMAGQLDVHYASSTPPLEDPGVVQFIKQNSAPADTVFSTGWPGIYVESDRRHAVRESVFLDAFLDLYPGSTDEERLAPVYRELVKSRPKVIYIEPWLNDRRIRHVNTLVLPFIRAFGYKQINEHLYVRPD